MRTPVKSLVYLLGVCLAGVWTAACGSGSVADSISSPDVAGRGATIQGKVTAGSGSGSSAFGFGAALASQPVHVSVVGSNQSTTTDRQGRFTLGGVPAGSVILRFQASGVDARLSLGGLVEGQVLTIDVQVSGSDAKLVSDRDDHEFTGTVESVTPPTLVVSGVTVLTNDSTEIKRGSLRIAVADIQPGEAAKVEGEQQADGSVLAREIRLSSEAQGSEVEFTGAVESVTPPSLVVAGRSVLTDANTKFKGNGSIHSVADLNVGDVVEVEGLESTTGGVLARVIKRLQTAGDDDEDDDDDDDEGDDDEDDGDDDDSGGSGS